MTVAKQQVRSAPAVVSDDPAYNLDIAPEVVPLITAELFGTEFPSWWEAPECQLLFAALIEAMLLVRNAAFTGPSKRADTRHATAAAQRWFAAESRSYLFGFGTICDVLGIQPEDVRRTLLANPDRPRLYVGTTPRGSLVTSAAV